MSDQTHRSTPSSPEPFTRRHFLGRLAAVGAVSLGGSTLVSACGGGDDAPATEATPEAGAAPSSEYPVVEASTCEGYDALDEQALATRQSLDYKDVSTEEGKYCGNCYFKQDYEADAQCLGCQLFPGPVSPAGWCQTWAIQQA